MSTQIAEIDTLKEILQRQQKSAMDEYFSFLKFESISSEANHTPQVLACADWLVKYLQKMGFTVELWPTPGHPTIYATHLKAGPDKPTLLIYNHYDVQPVDPLEQWITPPFEPTIREGEVFARGAQDNKGQCFYVLQGIKALLERDKKLPINIKLCIEGEEETGSMGLSKILPQKQKELKADYLAVVDMGIRKPNVPAITLGLRGMVTMDLTVQGSNSDMHSGSNGGLFYNPIHALVELLAKLRDPSGKITIPGFYDDVIPLDPEEKAQIAFTFDEKAYEKMFGAKPTGGEHAYSPLERVWTRPTLEINGITGGYSGTGFKTVIPAHASAKISCRLVPDQDPKKIGSLVAKFIEKNAPDGVKVEVKLRPGGGKSVRASPSSRVVKAFAQAFGEVFQKPCEFIFEGASVPIIPELAAASESEVILLGLGLPDDKIHAPNEHFGIKRLEQGALAIARGIELLGKKK